MIGKLCVDNLYFFLFVRSTIFLHTLPSQKLRLTGAVMGKWRRAALFREATIHIKRMERIQREILTHGERRDTKNHTQYAGITVAYRNGITVEETRPSETELVGEIDCRSPDHFFSGLSYVLVTVTPLGGVELFE